MNKKEFEQKYLNKNVIVELKTNDDILKGKLITGKEVWEKYRVYPNYYWIFNDKMKGILPYGFKFSHVKKIMLVGEVRNHLKKINENVEKIESELNTLKEKLYSVRNEYIQYNKDTNDYNCIYGYPEGTLTFYINNAIQCIANALSYLDDGSLYLKIKGEEKENEEK